MDIPAGLNAACMSRRLLAYDDFSEANGTVINGKSLDIGGAWARVRNTGTGQGIVTSGYATMSADTQDWLVCGETNVDCVLSATITSQNNAPDASILFVRHSGAQYVGDYVAAYIDTNTSIRILQAVAGVVNTIATNTAVKWPVSTSGLATVVINGATVTLTTPYGSLSTTITASAYNRCGMSLYRSGRIDNFKVEAL